MRSTSVAIAVWLRLPIIRIALPVAGHGAIVGLGRALADVDHVAPEHAVALPGVPAGLAQRAASAQAGGEFATQRAAQLHVYSDW